MYWEKNDANTWFGYFDSNISTKIPVGQAAAIIERDKGRFRASMLVGVVTPVMFENVDDAKKWVEKSYIEWRLSR